MSSASHLLSGRLLAANVVWSLAGAGLPLIVGLWAMPILIGGLGTERFGLLAIVWMGIGYFSLFDLGIGRALTKHVAERLGAGREAELSRLISVGLRLMAALGVGAAVLLAVITPILADKVLAVPEWLHGEAKWSFWVLSATLPLVISTAGLIGVLQAYQRFKAVAAVRIPLGVANFIGPLLVLPLTDSLVATTATLAVARFGAWLAYYGLCLRYLRRGASVSTVPARSLVRELLSYGGWITVSNIVGPLMVYFDRLFVGALLGLAAVTYYTTPYEVITRLWIVPVSIMNVLFPALTTALSVSIVRAGHVYKTAVIAQMAVIFPLISIVTLFSKEGLELWLNIDFAVESAGVLKWLALGVLINSFARLPLTVLQGKGRPDLTAKAHLVELPLYAIALWYFTEIFGIEGAAAVWTGRIVLDFLLLTALSVRSVPELAREQFGSALWVSVFACAVWVMWLIDEPRTKVIVLLPVILVFAALGFSAYRHVQGEIFQREGDSIRPPGARS